MTQLLSTWPDSSESRQRMLESSSSTQFNQAYAYPERSKWLTFLGMMRRCKNALILILTPILFSPLVMSEKPESRCGWCVIVMAIYWMTEVMPLAVTAMLPVVLFPLTGVLDCNTTAKEFMNDTNFLFIGGLIMAAAVEKCDLHERVALFVLKMVGGEPKWIMLGFMLVTALLSMFISNTATTAMMVPIGQSVVSQLIASFESHPQNPESGRAGCKSMATGLVMSICFAANIGGTGTATGTPSNLVMLGQLTNLFPKADGSLNYISWIFFAVPLMCICLACAWALLCFFFLRHAPAKDDHVTDMLHSRYDKLPRMSFAEKSVLFCFNLLLILWIFRNPGVVKGFGSFFPKGYYTDATSAMLVAFLLFVLPAEKPNLFEYIRAEDMKKKSCLMDWPTMQRTFPWSVVLLLGGGFALAAGVKESKLSILVGHMLAEYGHLPLWCLQLLTMTIAMAVTNICSNTVTASIFVPIVATLAQQTGNHPFTLMLPVTLGCSFAFVLPVGTPPNAIVFGSGMVKVSNMVTVGLCLSIVTLFLTVAYMNTLALMFLPLNTFPEWAQLDNSTTISAG